MQETSMRQENIALLEKYKVKKIQNILTRNTRICSFQGHIKEQKNTIGKIFVHEKTRVVSMRKDKEN